MPDPAAPPTLVCGHCDGFPVVAIDSGTRNPDGTRRILKVACPNCEGAGTTARRAPVTEAASC
ncbi:hypothetical protein AB0M28_35055 [Streptomyces sp. NPDC051940]|uniref:hypothetical protein n=1 Tax=Streptomyces sp. NPDC051940 TaxID=3155675 RepID=UPI003448A862